MKKMRFYLLLIGAFLLSSCSFMNECDSSLMEGCFDGWFRLTPKKQQVQIKPNPCAMQFYKGTAGDVNDVQDSNAYYVNDVCAIALQNLENRDVVYCYSNPQTSAEACAQHYEKKGFVRFREIPYKSANYDFLKVDTYPTRRWRDNELTSRW